MNAPPKTDEKLPWQTPRLDVLALASTASGAPAVQEVEDVLAPVS